MGRFGDKAKQIKKENEGFKPLDLTEGNIQAIFNRCLATDFTKEHIKSILQQKAYGCDQDSEGILFDREKVIQSLQSIKYLYGQLLTTHKKTNTINISTKSSTNAMTNYTESIWTNNKRYYDAIISFRYCF